MSRIPARPRSPTFWDGHSSSCILICRSVTSMAYISVISHQVIQLAPSTHDTMVVVVVVVVMVVVVVVVVCVCVRARVCVCVWCVCVCRWVIG